LHDLKKFEVLEKNKKIRMCGGDTHRKEVISFKLLCNRFVPFRTSHIAKQRKYTGFSKIMLVLGYYYGLD